MKLKKVLATGLSLLMAMGTIAGCGVSTDTGVNTNASSESGVAAAEKTDQKEESTTKTDGDVEEITWMFWDDMDLEMKLDGLKKHTGGKDKRKDILDTILDRMTKEGFIECVSDMNGTWKVLSSWDYLTKMIHSINIKNEDEISQ